MASGVTTEARDLRIAIIGNAGGGKSTLARTLAALLRLPHIEVDRLLWQPNWTATAATIYEADHDQAIAMDAWVIDGLGRKASISDRLSRATTIIILVDMPLWMRVWLAAERQIA